MSTTLTNRIATASQRHRNGIARRAQGMRICEILWDEPKARIAEELFEEATGKQCPCKTGGHCPLLPTSILVRPRAEARA